MVIDTSAILAILQSEPEQEVFVRAIESTGNRNLSIVSFVEISIVTLARRGNEGVRNLDLFLAKAQIDVQPVDSEQGYIARKAFREFGKGRHPAQLNFGDCFSYALARSLEQPLLFKGDDFTKTDVVRFSVSQFSQ